MDASKLPQSYKKIYVRLIIRIVGHMRPGSVWTNIEKPTLMKNSAVTHIVEHDTVHNKVHTYDKATGETTTVDGHKYKPTN
jgi:hypothetical protein